MTYYKRMLPGVIAVLLLMLSLLIYWRHLYNTHHFSCEGQIAFVTDKGVFDVLMNFTFSGEAGLYTASGKYAPLSGKPVKTRNKVTFNYWRKGQNVYLISKETNELPKTETPLLSWKPDFFTSRDRGIVLQVARENARGLLFFYDNAPLFYCERQEE